MRIPQTFDINGPAQPQPTVLANAIFTVANYDNIEFHVLRDEDTTSDKEVVLITARRKT